MTILFLFIILLSLYKIRIKTFNADYLSIESTKSINGIFVLIVFLRHFIEYVDSFSKGILDQGYLLFDALMGQLIVVSFLFYSGYGIMESIKSKGKVYVNGIIKNRLFFVWLHFFIAVLLYMILNYFVGKEYSIEHNLLSLTGYESIGNSNWYVFAMLMLYIFTFISFKVFDKYTYSLIMMIICCLAYTFILIYIDKGIWWYNTIVIYPIGMLYSLIKNKYESFIKQSVSRYIGVLGVSFILFILFYAIGRQGVFLYWIIGALFMIILVTLTMKIAIKNKYLVWLGGFTFEIYILQRIPMIVLSKHIGNRYVLCIGCFVVAVILAIIFKKIMNRLDAIIKNRFKIGAKI